MLIVLRTCLLNNIAEDCLTQLCFLSEIYCSCLIVIETDALVCLIRPLPYIHPGFALVNATDLTFCGDIKI